MEVKSFRAKTLQEALMLVRRELGPDASVLHTREVTSGLLRWMGAGRQIEVIATGDDVDIPSRLPPEEGCEDDLATYAPLHEDYDPRAQFQRDLTASAIGGVDIAGLATPSINNALSKLHRELLVEEWPVEACDEFVGRIAQHTHASSSQELPLLRAHLASLIEACLLYTSPSPRD